MTTYSLSPSPWLQFVDANGNPYAGAQLFTYESGTSTPLAVYGDSQGLTLLTNPIVLDAAGRCGPMYLQYRAYKFVLAPANDTNPPVSPIKTTDPVGPVPQSTVDVDIAVTAGEDLSANMPVYMSDGSASTTVGRWYKADSDAPHSSISALAIGMTTAAITSGTSGTVRLAGYVPALGLTAGATYYASATAGVLTSTPPANARIWGVADTSGGLVLGDKRPIDVRRMTSFQTVTGNVGAGEDTLATYSAGAGGIYEDGMGWRVTFWGLAANNANAKQLRLRLIEGANNHAIANFPLTASIVGLWDLQAVILRVSATTFSSYARVTDGIDTGPISRGGSNVFSSSTATFANSIELRLTGQATTTDDVQVIGGLIERIGIGR